MGNQFLVIMFRSLIVLIIYGFVSYYFSRHTGRNPIHGDASAKAAVYRDRFLLLFQRLSRDPHFSRPTFASDISEYGSCEVRSLFFLTWICTPMLV